MFPSRRNRKRFRDEYNFEELSKYSKKMHIDLKNQLMAISEDKLLKSKDCSDFLRIWVLVSGLQRKLADSAVGVSEIEEAEHYGYKRIKDDVEDKDLNMRFSELFMHDPTPQVAEIFHESMDVDWNSNNILLSQHLQSTENIISENVMNDVNIYVDSQLGQCSQPAIHRNIVDDWRTNLGIVCSLDHSEISQSLQPVGSFTGKNGMKTYTTLDSVQVSDVFQISSFDKLSLPSLSNPSTWQFYADTVYAAIQASLPGYQAPNIIDVESYTPSFSDGLDFSFSLPGIWY